MHSTKFLSVVLSTARSIILRGHYLLSDPTPYSFYLLLHGPHLLCGPNSQLPCGSQLLYNCGLGETTTFCVIASIEDGDELLAWLVR